MFKIVVVLMLALIIGSLFSGLLYLYRDRGAGSRVVKMLTVRISLSIVLFIGLMVMGWYRASGG